MVFNISAVLYLSPVLVTWQKTAIHY